jgi:heat shock protein HslJ
MRIARLAAVALIVAACSSLSVDGQDLAGTRWKAVSIAGQAPIAGSEPTLIFDGGRIEGSSGCNTYESQGPVTITGGSIKIGTTLMTLGRCIETGGGDAPVTTIEIAFSAALDAADRIGIRGNQLVLSGSAGELVFERRP